MFRIRTFLHTFIRFILKLLFISHVWFSFPNYIEKAKVSIGTPFQYRRKQKTENIKKDEQANITKNKKWGKLRDIFLYYWIISESGIRKQSLSYMFLSRILFLLQIWKIENSSYSKQRKLNRSYVRWSCKHVSAIAEYDAITL